MPIVRNSIFLCSLSILALLLGCSTTVVSPAISAQGATPVSKQKGPLSLSIGGRTSLEYVGMTSQMTASAAYGSEAPTDVTNSVTWTTAPSAVASVSAAGLVTCNAIGEFQLSAAMQNVTNTLPFTCSDQLASISLSETTVSIRAGAQVRIRATAATAKGNTVDITSVGLWTASNHNLSFSQPGTIFCSAAGGGSARISYLGLSQALSVSCSQPSWNTPSYFTENSDEFVGPFPSWIDVRQTFGAVGDGHTDDTKALQAGLNSLDQTKNRAVLWIPRGTYLISETLQVTAQQYFSIIGEDPQNTILKWGGPPGGIMLRIAGSSYFRVSRATLDGAGVAGTAEQITNAPTGTYTTYNELSDQHIKGVRLGIDLDVAAETTIQRIHFDTVSFGLSVGNPNALNIFIDNSLFTDCGTGVTNTLGAGNFIVSNSFFLRSTTADMSIGNTGYFTARHNASVGSLAFFVAGPIGANPAQITLQNNTVIGTHISPVELGDQGPLMMIDNVFRMDDTSLPTVTAFYDSSVSKSIFSFGNTFTSAVPPQSISSDTFQGVIYSADDFVVSPSEIPDVQVPTGVYVPPNAHRKVYEVSQDGDGTEIQQQIDNAVSAGYASSVIHIPAGTHHVASTLTLPASTAVSLIGDDSHLSALVWDSPVSQPVIDIQNPDASVKFLRIDRGVGVRPEGIRLEVIDQPGSHVVMDQALLQGGNDIAVDFDGIEHVNAELFSGYTMGSVTGVRVAAGQFRAGHVGTLGTTNFYTGSLQSERSGTSFDVSLHGKFLVQDNWHDGGATGPRNFRLSGSGTVTEQAGMVDMSSSQAFEIDNFDGKVALIGLQFYGGFLLNPGTSQTKLLTLGLVGADPNYLPNSTGNIQVENVLDAYYQGGGHQLAMTDQPDPSLIRSMLAQTRAEYPVRRETMSGQGHRARIQRVQIFNMTEAIHLLPKPVKHGLYYSLANSTGTISTLRVGSGQACSGSSAADLLPTGSWELVATDEGDYVLTDFSGALALGLHASDSGAPTVTMSPVESGYEQRWRAESLGDGTFAFWNRATNSVLDWSSGACPVLSPSPTNGTARWTVVAN